MKRILLFTIALMLCAFTFAQQVVPVSAIVPGQKYNIKHVDAGLYLSYAEGGNSDFALANLPAGGDVNFDFSFTPIAGAENTYNVAIAGQYLNGSGYNVFLGDATGTNGQILLTGSETFTMKTLWNKFINLNANTAGSKIWGDKGNGAVWQLELSANALDDAALLAVAKASLLSAITSVNNFYTETAGLVGNAPGQYSASAREALQAAITSAQAIYDSSTATLDVVVQAAADVASALATYKSSVNVLSLPVTGKSYNIKHVNTGLYFTANLASTASNVTSIADATGDENQLFSVVDAGDGNVNLAVGGRYLTQSTSYRWDANLSDNSAANETKYRLIPEGTGIKIQALFYAAGADSYLAPQGTAPGTTCFLNTTALSSRELWQFEEVINTDILEVKTLTPLADATNVSSPAAISVLFSNLIEAGDLSGITMKDAAGNSVEGVAATISSMRLNITYTGKLAYETTYTVTVPANAITGYAQPITWSFTTAASVLPKEGRFYNIVNATSNYLLTLPDVPPAADSPFSAASKVDGNANQVFLFEQANPADPSVYNILIYSTKEFVSKVANSAWSMTTSTDPAADVSKFVVTEEGQNIKIQALTQANKAQYLGPNNATDGVACYLDKTANITWRLEEANVPLALYKTLPAANAVEVALDAPVLAQFNKDIVASNLETIVIKDDADNTVLGVSATASGNTISIAHNEFAFGTTYTVLIPANVVEGITEPTTWSFTTETAPAITSVTPAAGVTDVTIDAPISANFNKIFLTGDLTGVTLTANAAPVANVQASVSGQAIIITHPALDYSTVYTVTIPATAVKGLASDYSWSFTTTPAPTIRSTTPVDGATNVALTTLIRVTYDKKPVEGSAGLTGVTLKNAAGTDITGKVSISGTALVITKATGVALEEGTTYTVTVPANTFKGITEPFSYSFTTAGLSGIDDVDADNAIAVYPSNGSIVVHTPSAAAISIVDVSGKQLASYQSSGDITIPVNSGGGLYIVRVNSGGSISSHKVIVK